MTRDGLNIAYISTQVASVRLGNVMVFQQLWLADLNRGGVRQVFIDGAECIDPAWSPSGQELAVALNSTGQLEIWIIRFDGKPPRQLTSGTGAKKHPAWSPDGRQLLFTHLHDGKYGLSLISIEGGEPKRFTPFGPASEIQVCDADWK